MSLYGKTHRNDGDFFETLFRRSLKIVGVINRLVSNYADKILEKRGFSLFCHVYLLVSNRDMKMRSGWRDVIQSHVTSAVTSPQTRFSISWRSVACACGDPRGLTSALLFLVRV